MRSSFHGRTPRWTDTTHCPDKMHAAVMFHEDIPNHLENMAWTKYHKWMDGWSDMGIELSSLLMTYHLSMLHPPVNFHDYIPYGLGVMDINTL